VPRWAAIFLLLTLPLSASAQREESTRRDGFLLIWESVRRPVIEQTVPEFEDVLEGDRGYQEITYAAWRKILDQASIFYPDATLTVEDALLWLFRTRNVDDLDRMQRDNIPHLLERYPILPEGMRLGTTAITRDELLAFISALDRYLREEVHTVSFYADDFHGRGTAFGETFDMNALTAAHRTYPSNTLVRVTNVEDGESVVVRINDRGPYVDGRDMDLSLAAFEQIAHRGEGVLRATFHRLGDKSLVDACTQTATRYQKRITRDVRFHRGIPHTWHMGEQITLGANRYFVVRGIRYPDGYFARLQDWVGPKERYSFTPHMEGEYVFLVGNKEGKQREMRMRVRSCSLPG